MAASPDPRSPAPFSISPNDLLVFSAVARAGGIRGAASELRMPRSTVSRQLAALERSLGGRLVTRTTRRFALTDMGRSLVEHCARLEEVLRESERVAHRELKEPTGLLRVAASPVVGEEILPPIIAELIARHPGLKIQVELAVDFVDLRRSGIDVAIRTGPLEDATDLFALRLGESKKGHYASPGYLQSRAAPERPAELAGHECIVVGSRTARWSFEGVGRKPSVVPVKGRLSVDSYRLALELALQGAGIARLPRFCAEPFVRSGQLRSLLEGHAPTATLYAVHALGQPPPPRVRVFLDALRAPFARYLA